jgi:glycerol kinase
MPEEVRGVEYRRWKKAVQRSLGWLDEETAVPAGRGR